jgi:hypothetical protein
MIICSIDSDDGQRANEKMCEKILTEFRLSATWRSIAKQLPFPRVASDSDLGLLD